MFAVAALVLRRKCAIAFGAVTLVFVSHAFAQLPERGDSPNDVRVIPARPGSLGDRAIDATDPNAAQNVAAIRIEGETTIPEYAIRRYLRTQTDRPLSYLQIQEDVAALLGTNWFLSVNHSVSQSADGPVVTYHVVEAPAVRSVEFEGNDKISDRELEAHTGLMAGHGFDPMLNRRAVERIRQLYLDKGYRHVEVELIKGGDPADRDVHIRITEGPKVRLWWISFEGNQFAGDAILKTKIASKSVILWLIGGDYDPTAIQADVRAITMYYQGLGFMDVEVVAEELVSDDRAWVSIVFHVNEGQRYQVRHITIIGNDVLRGENLLAEPQLNPGDPYNARFMRADVDYMKDQYGELGRLFATVQPVPRFLEEDGILDLEYQIDEDRPYYFGQVNVHIRGDYPHSREYVVRNQINPFVKPGHLARSSDLEMAQARVLGSHLWEPTEPPTFDVQPVDGLDYLPSQPTALGQDSALDDSLEQRVFDYSGHLWRETGMSIFEDPLLPYTQSDPVIEQTIETQRDVRYGHSIAPASSSVTPASPSMMPPQESHEVAVVSSVPVNSRPMRPTAAPERVIPQVPIAATSTPSATSSYRIDPAVLINAPEENEFVVRGQSPIYRSQSIDQNGQPIPPSPIFNNSPQGDPFGDAMRGVYEPGFVDVNIDVTEGRTGRLMFGVGVNSDAGVVGSLIFQEDNFDILRPPSSWADVIEGRAFRGNGQSFRIEAVPGDQVSRYMVSWTDPFFMYTDYSLGVSGFYYNRFYNDWTEDRLGGRVSVGRLLNRYWSINGAIRLENVDIRDTPAVAPPDLEEVEGDNFLSTGMVTLSYDSRNSAFIPSQGTLFEGSYEQAFGEFDYPKFELTGSQYWTIYERPDGYGKHTFNLRGQVGWTGNGTPIFERFYAGGYSSFRGFAFRGVSPREMDVRVGGNFQFLGTAEYMMPVTASDMVRAVVFSDFGTVEEKATFDDFRVTAGFGVRLTIPAMGPAPLAFDFAFPIMDEPEDNRRIFSFYIGLTR